MFIKTIQESIMIALEVNIDQIISNKVLKYLVIIIMKVTRSYFKYDLYKFIIFKLWG